MNILCSGKKAIFFLFLIFSSVIHTYGQDNKTSSLREDTLKQRIKNAKTLKDKISQSSVLAGYYLRNNKKEQSDSLINFFLHEAENSNNKEVVSWAYNHAGILNYSGKSEEYLIKSYETAIAAKLTDRATQAAIYIAGYKLKNKDYDEAINQYNKIDLNDDGISDSTRYLLYMGKATLYGEKEDMLNKFRMLFKAKKYAEKTGDNSLTRGTIEIIADGYQRAKDYASALKYYSLVKESFQKDNLGYGVIRLELKMGRLYQDMEKYDDAEMLLNNTINHADSIGDNSLKYAAVESLCYVYFERDAEKFIATVNKYQLINYYLTKNDTANYYNWKGDVFFMTNGLDSAEYYYSKTVAILDAEGDQNWKAYQLKWMGIYYRRKGDNAQSLYLLKRSLSAFESLKIISGYADIYKELDSTYSKLGDYKNGYEAKTKYLFYKDSLDKMNKKDDILKEEIAAEEESMAKAEAAEKKVMERKHDIQYRVIILGGILLLIGLLAIGFFHPPQWLVRGLAFVSFIFIFEFIILILDSKLHHWFHGAPLPILGTKVLIACLLVPLHHLVEKKVIHFLQSKKLHRLKTVFKDEPVKSV